MGETRCTSSMPTADRRAPTRRATLSHLSFYVKKLRNASSDCGQFGIARTPHTALLGEKCSGPPLAPQQAPQTFRELRRIRQDVQVVLASGYDQQEIVARFAGRGLAGFLQKPFEFNDLVARMRQVLEG